MKKSTFILPFIAMALASCSGSDKKGNDSEVEKKPIVKVETVNNREVIQEGNYTATVIPALVNNISASAPNRIKEIYVDEGVKVQKGQVLAILDDVNTVNYENQVANAKANLDNVKLNYDRAVQLLKIGGGTQQNVDQMQLQLTNAQTTLATAERTLRNCKENTVLTSPISGVVTARNYDPGDMTANLPVLTVARVQPVKAVINISEKELSKINKGMPAKLTFDTYGDESFEGQVSMVMPVVDTDSRTFGVEITLPNADSRILPGMFGRATLNLGVSDHVVVPDRAVVKQQGSGNHYVYVYDPKTQTVSYNLVELGQRIGDSYELLSGVEAGSQVVVSGQTKLTAGKAVEVAE